MSRERSVLRTAAVWLAATRTFRSGEVENGDVLSGQGFVGNPRKSGLSSESERRRAASGQADLECRCIPSICRIAQGLLHRSQSCPGVDLPAKRRKRQRGTGQGVEAISPGEEEAAMHDGNAEYVIVSVAAVFVLHAV